MTGSALLPFALWCDVWKCVRFPSHILAYAGFQFSEIDVGTVEHFQGQEQMRAERRRVSVEFCIFYALSWSSKKGQGRHAAVSKKNGKHIDILLPGRSVESLSFRPCEAVSMQRSGHCRIVRKWHAASHASVQLAKALTKWQEREGEREGKESSRSGLGDLRSSRSSRSSHWRFQERSRQYPQHISTHLNTSQHISTHLNTSQHISTHLNTSQHISTHLNTIRSINTMSNPFRNIRNLDT